MGLHHVVITAVDRDDLPDGGATGFVECVRRLKALEPAPTVEVLTPDFRGEPTSVDRIVDAGPDVYNHNVETVPSQYRRVRRSGRYSWALEVLRRVAERAPAKLRKSGSWSASARPAMRCGGARRLGGGRLPGGDDRPVPAADAGAGPGRALLHPDEFAELEAAGRAVGLEVVAGPFVRSSYRAEEAFLRVLNR